MTRVTYDLRDPASVNAYLDAVAGEHGVSFERWRVRRISEGFHKFTVDHPDDSYIELGGRLHRIKPKEDTA
jgi:hypothetical protein